MESSLDGKAAEVSDMDTLGFHVDRFLDLIPSDGSEINLREPLHNLFLDLSTEFLFGQCIDAQLPDDPNNSKDLLKAFNGALADVGKRRLAGKLQSTYYFDSSWKRDTGKVYAYVDAHVKRVLDKGSAKEKTIQPLNPEIWTQLRAESIRLGDQPPTFESLKSLRSFRNVLQETLRLQGPAGRPQRLALKNTILPVGGGPDGQSPIFVE
ncbi:hypothetical protein BPOR_0102g00040 [Botrytis porri]|uniref:Uncharacterized protein n=1 Tax=Botrytis porri TaxID=87229 RepID=A0A4Z1KYJ6_9HELO|nr:hypothetical protein BPOR_0102g00040 [Botrytis porri]